MASQPPDFNAEHTLQRLHLHRSSSAPEAGSEKHLDARKKQNGIMSGVSSIFKHWGGHKKPEGRSNDASSSQSKLNKNKKKRRYEQSKNIERKKLEKKKQKEEDRVLDNLAHELLVGNVEDSDELYSLQMLVQTHRINAEAGTEFASCRLDLLDDIRQLEKIYANKLEETIAKHKEKIRKSICNITSDQFEAFKRWGIQESLQLLDVLSVKVKDSHKIAEECRNCRIELKGLLESPVFGYAQQEKWDYLDMRDQVHNLNKFSHKINRKLKRLFKPIDSVKEAGGKEPVVFGDNVCIPHSEKEQCRLTSPQSRSKLMDDMRQYVQKLQEVSDQRNQYYHVLLKKIQRRLRECSQACESGLQGHKEKFEKCLTLWAMEKDHHVDYNFKMTNVDDLLTKSLEQDENQFQAAVKSSTLVSPSQLAEAMERLPGYFHDRLLEWDPETTRLKPNLGDILGDDSLRRCFWKYLKSKYCDEHISFLLAVDNLIDQDDENIINQQINDIYLAYIDENSAQQINLPSEVQEEIETVRSKLATTAEFQSMYEKAYKNIANLLFKGLFSTFVNSSAYEVWFTETVENM